MLSVGNRINTKIPFDRKQNIEDLLCFVRLQAAFYTSKTLKHGSQAN